jgi:hypothetical protein
MAGLPGGVLGASHWTVTPAVAAPGDRIRVEVRDTGQHDRRRASELYLNPAVTRFGEQGECHAEAGARKVAVIHWVRDGGLDIGTAEFTLPAVPKGPYQLAEDLPGDAFLPCLGSGAGSLKVTGDGRPDTALADPIAWRGSNWLLVVIGFLALTVGLRLAIARAMR